MRHIESTKDDSTEEKSYTTKTKKAASELNIDAFIHKRFIQIAKSQSQISTAKRKKHMRTTYQGESMPITNKWKLLDEENFNMQTPFDQCPEDISDRIYKIKHKKYEKIEQELI